MGRPVAALVLSAEERAYLERQFAVIGWHARCQSAAVSSCAAQMGLRAKLLAKLARSNVEAADMTACCPPPSRQLSDSRIVIDSVITCPLCGTAKTEQMPLNSCRIVYECTGCGSILRPKPGDCCVYCSYGSVPCPPIQAAPLAQ